MVAPLLLQRKKKKICLLNQAWLVTPDSLSKIFLYSPNITYILQIARMRKGNKKERAKWSILVILRKFPGSTLPKWLFSCWAVSDSLPLHGLQCTRLPCPSVFPRVCTDSCLLSQWCYLTILSSATSFSVCFQSFPAAGSFSMSQLFDSGGQSINCSFIMWTEMVQIRTKDDLLFQVLMFPVIFRVLWQWNKRDKH